MIRQGRGEIPAPSRNRSPVLADSFGNDERNSTMHPLYEKMSTLSTEVIIEAMVKTWNDPEGEIIREEGFAVIDERVSEEESDRIYAECYAKAA